MASPPETAPPKTDGSFETIGQLFKEFGGLIGSIAGFATAVGIVWQTESDTQRWAVLGIAGLILLYAIIAQVISPWLARRNRRRVIELVESDEPLKPATFRLRPYEERDHDNYDRPDDAHKKAVHWLDEAKATCIYLTGFSGTGKSSLLQAWLIPELATADQPVWSVVVRSFADPIGQLVEALKAKDALPVDLPKEETDPRVLLERAAEVIGAQNGRLLIAIDQFEECLILQDEATKKRLAALFADLQDKPIDGLQLLFVMRTDYLKFDELTALGLPDPRPRENWFNLEALSHADARTILRQTLPNMDRGLEDQVIEEASDVDDLPGLIRPITLNMMGLILRSFAGAALTKTAPGRLIQDFLRRAIEKPGIDQLAPKLLAAMITDKGTKKPMEEAALASATGTEPAMTRKTLYLLGEEGIVRELDRGQNVWEISHDFVARQLGQIIPRLKPSWWQRAQSAATPVALISWLIIGGAGYPLYGILKERAAYNALRAKGVTVLGEQGDYRIYFDDYTDEDAIGHVLSRATELNPKELTISSGRSGKRLDLASLTGLTDLTISGNDGLQALDGLGGLENLTSLTISSNSELQVLDGLGSLENLTDLKIIGNNGLRALDGLGGLENLTSLTISDNNGLQVLDGLGGLENLTDLTINSNFGLQVLDGLGGLENLTSLAIINNDGLQALDGLGGLENLTSLTISSNDGLQALDGLGGLENLTSLAIISNDGLQALDGLGGLENLTSLTVNSNDGLQALDGLGGLENLTDLTISDNNGLQALPSLKTHMKLNVVRIYSGHKFTDIPELGDLNRFEMIALDIGDIEATIEALQGVPDKVTIETNYNIDDFSKRLGLARNALGLEVMPKVAPRRPGLSLLSR